MNTDLQDIGRALLAMCLISCSHIAQSAVTATHSVARITAYIVDEPHIQVPQQFNSDAAKSITAQAGLSIPQSLPSAIAFQRRAVLQSHTRSNFFNRATHNSPGLRRVAVPAVGMTTSIATNGV